MDRYPATIYLGAAILGKVCGEMIMTDAAVVRALAPGNVARYAVELILIVGLIVAGRAMARKRRKPKPSAA